MQKNEALIDTQASYTTYYTLRGQMIPIVLSASDQSFCNLLAILREELFCVKISFSKAIDYIPLLLKEAQSKVCFSFHT